MPIDYSIMCPHCGFLVPVESNGKKIVVKIPSERMPRAKREKPEEDKTDMRGLLGELHDPYWLVASVFGLNKNYQPTKTGKMFLEIIGKGISAENMLIRAKSLRQSMSEQKYMPQFQKWLEGLILHPLGDISEPTKSRLEGRAHAE